MPKTGNLVIDYLAKQTADAVNAAIANPDTPQELKELLWMQKTVIDALSEKLETNNLALIKRLNLDNVSV